MRILKIENDETLDLTKRELKKVLKNEIILYDSENKVISTKDLQIKKDTIGIKNEAKIRMVKFENMLNGEKVIYYLIGKAIEPLKE